MTSFRLIRSAAAALLLLAPLPAQVFTFNKDQMVKYTAKNPFERFEDGRPKVPDALLEKCKGLSAEEVWAVLGQQRSGFPNQYEGNWRILHPERKLVGRALTMSFLPFRQDVFDVEEKEAHEHGAGPGAAHQRILDKLQDGDVLVVDLFGKIEEGTITGDNLATYVYAATHRGMVVDGAVRDLEGISPIDMSVYIRGVHPTPLRNIVLAGYNIPIRIGGATVVPGDVVFGDKEGIYFIPPEKVKEIVDKADITHIHDEWTQMKIKTGKYKSTDIYPSPRDPELKKEYQEYLKQHLGK